MMVKIRFLIILQKTKQFSQECGVIHKPDMLKVIKNGQAYPKILIGASQQRNLALDKILNSFLAIKLDGRT